MVPQQQPQQQQPAQFTIQIQKHPLSLTDMQHLYQQQLEGASAMYSLPYEQYQMESSSYGYQQQQHNLQQQQPEPVIVEDVGDTEAGATAAPVVTEGTEKNKKKKEESRQDELSQRLGKVSLNEEEGKPEWNVVCDSR